MERLKYVFMLLFFMRCEMCGNESECHDAIVEGVMLKVCNECGKYGKAIKIEHREIIESKEIVFKENIEEVVDNYSMIVKEAREKLGLKQEEVAFKIAEKESIIHAIESGKLRPSLDVARKLEKFFHINLVEIYKEEKKTKKINFKDTDVTIGDLIKAGK